MFGFLKTSTPQVDQEVQEEFVERVSAAAEDFRAVAASHGRLDYTPASMAALDEALARVRAGDLALTPMQRVGAAAYLYETLRRAHGGLYEVCDNDDPVVFVAGPEEAEVCLCGISRVERYLTGAHAEPVSAALQRFEAALAAGRAETIR
ncbi:hypothetical protein CEG14_22975 [Bordetella genomosp. 1]|uniref:Uncharacterized protein n=1 Tax=Bordetella genomosp. 1 TaxID=1395607 RepID=A0A261RVL4_9BORD|nr:hypothetical protein [Bordetella genomosp. 1]MDQ8034087.1 hypothetical protein [Bordetella sp.]OZI28807.1 hypothetical protein CEG14_22975 [Bordetella genomosp. 1]OZI67919.1 hypothetical protein CAL27_00130 [Bordetella genomosp. 1]